MFSGNCTVSGLCGLFQMSGSSVILNSMAIDSAVSVESDAVICGVTYNSDDSAVYEIADSNTTTIQLAYVDSNASLSSADFVYAPDYMAEYYSWYQVYSYLPDNTNIPS